MKVYFRADASIDIGSGHVMRCLTLADALREKGAECCFICREHPGNLLGYIRKRGFRVYALPRSKVRSGGEEPLTQALPTHAAWLGSGWKLDAKQTMAAIGTSPADWLIIDHYALDYRWEASMRGQAHRIMVIDDLADRVHDCDILLDQNLYTDLQVRYHGKVPDSCELFLGPRFALLRNEFRQLRSKAKLRTRPAQRVLVFFGGVDTANLTGRTVEVLASLHRPELQVDVVIGYHHPCRAKIEKECGRFGYRCHVQTERMAELMLAADLAVGAGGSASWERCCLGLPAVLVSLANNQTAIATALDLFGACIHLGEYLHINAEDLRTAILGLLHDHKRLNELSDKAFSLVDGLGTDRICKALVY